ncbi:MAG: toprim domain-containing protein [Rhodobacter sp.]|jgi:hypothetical protein|nr:toprim domain-containing protein [Rhodobacter sp.]
MTDASEITLTLGGEWRGNCGTAPCPCCQPERRHDQRALSIRAEGNRLLTFCHKSGCDFRSVLQAAGMPATTGAIDLAAARESSQKRAAYEAKQLARARKLWNGARSIRGTKGETYLRGRGINCPLPDSLRWASDCFHAPTARWLSAMVADVSTGGVHRTFFEKSGQRIERNDAKMMQGPCAGGAVALSEGPSRLVVAEGIETGLSLLSGLLDGPAAVWAALSTSGMRALHLPENPAELVVAADRDANGAGMAAAEALAERAQALGWAVWIWLPPEGQKDWNDALRAGVAA